MRLLTVLNVAFSRSSTITYLQFSNLAVNSAVSSYTFNQAKNYGAFETKLNHVTENARKVYEHMGIKNMQNDKLNRSVKNFERTFCRIFLETTTTSQYLPKGFAIVLDFLINFRLHQISIFFR